MKQVITAQEAAAMVQDDATLLIQGLICTSVPEGLIQSLATRYKETGAPKNLSLMFAGIGDGEESGVNALAQDGLVGELQCTHLGTVPKLAAMVNDNKFPAFIMPQGVFAQLVKAIGAKKPGVITHVGLKTYADPRVEGCKVNQAAKDSGKEIVELVKLGGTEYIRYLPRPIDICFIRGTSIDEHGNLTIEHEAMQFDQFEYANAVHNCGGIVIAQVERVVENHTLKPHEVVIPGFLIDYAVVGGEYHLQCTADPAFHPEWCGETRLPMSAVKPLPLNERKICGRRAAYLVKAGNHVNLGIGVPESVSAVAAEEGFSDQLTFSVECGIFGGVPQGGLRICCDHNPDAIISHVNTFDIYDGGGCDVAVLGAAEIDQFGNVNVSKFNGRTVGPGGFINITQSSQNVAFVGSFMAGKNSFEIGNGKLKVLQNGKYVKFKKQVEQITFSGEYAAEAGKNVLYITERAVFKLVKGGIELIEIAPGMDLEQDILAHMEFKPKISPDLKEMDAKIFMDQPMGLTV
jgi:propionate CoA-transferase